MLKLVWFFLDPLEGWTINQGRFHNGTFAGGTSSPDTSIKTISEWQEVISTEFDDKMAGSYLGKFFRDSNLPNHAKEAVAELTREY